MAAKSSIYIVDRCDLGDLATALQNMGYLLIAPTVRDNAIVYGEIDSLADLPQGWTDRQEAGEYRLSRRNDEALFGYNVGPNSWKKFLHPPIAKLWQAKREGHSFEIETTPEEVPQYAFIGVRSCELHAIAIQDKVFLEGPYPDPIYQKRRQNIFIVAVNCGQAGNTCFCVSMNTGPKADSGFDLALTEVLEEDSHYFAIEVGTENGAQVVEKIPHRIAQQTEVKKAADIVQQTKEQMGRTLDTKGIKELLYSNHDHPRWQDVADRCLSCANCTMACPTCFCTTVEDVTDLSGDHAERWRKWDSCFTMDFSYIHGGNVRASVKSRYRQWMTHKLASWHDQFGTSGCVGCGRCIAWCPVGIDITEEVRAIREGGENA